MMIIGVTAAKVTPWMTGILIPIFQIPKVWSSVARPQVNKSALIRKAVCDFDRPAAAAIIKGTATAPAYIASTCCNPNMKSFPAGIISSTGAIVCLVLAIYFPPFFYVNDLKSALCHLLALEFLRENYI